MKTNPSVIILGATGLIGSAMRSHFEAEAYAVTALHSRNYTEAVGKKADILINCNGNSYRFKANQDPDWDFQASVLSVERSLFDFDVEHYLYISTIDVYDTKHDLAKNAEEAVIRTENLDHYSFHKWTAERLVERYAKNHLILRAGTMVGAGIKKGPLFDILNDRPLSMSLDSELSIVDTAFIAQAVQKLIETNVFGTIINVTGKGYVRLRDLEPVFGRSIPVDGKAEHIIHRYDINTKKLQQFTAVPSAHDMTVTFLRNAKESSRATL